MLLLLAMAEGPGQGTPEIPAALLQNWSLGTCCRHHAVVSGSLQLSHKRAQSLLHPMLLQPAEAPQLSALVHQPWGAGFWEGSAPVLQGLQKVVGALEVGSWSPLHKR